MKKNKEAMKLALKENNQLAIKKLEIEEGWTDEEETNLMLELIVADLPRLIREGIVEIGTERFEKELAEDGDIYEY